MEKQSYDKAKNLFEELDNLTLAENVEIFGVAYRTVDSRLGGFCDSNFYDGLVLLNIKLSAGIKKLIDERKIEIENEIKNL